MPIPPLLLVLAAAVAAPLLAEATRRFGISVVVLELLLGVAIGPQGLDWAHVEGGLPYLATFGMAYLFFVAGLEIDLKGIAGAPLNRAIWGWLAAFALSCLVALGLRATGLVEAWLIVAIALATTALGVLVPILRDAELLESPLGRHVMAAGAVAEIGPILAMSMALSTAHAVDVQTGLTLAFIAIVLVVGRQLVRGARTPAVLGAVRRHLTRAGQLPVRVVTLVVVGFAVLAESFGLDLALGALSAGMVMHLATRDAHIEVLHHKIDAIGFGFVIPVFFIVSGMKLDVAAMLGKPGGLALAAAFFAAVLVLRLALALPRRDVGSLRERVALGLLSATTLSLVVALTQIGVERRLMKPAEAAPLVGGAMVTVLLFPPVALRLIGNKRSRKVDDRESL